MSSILYTVNNDTVIHDYEYTRRAAHNLSKAVSSEDFQDKSPETILSYLVDKMYRVSFGDYLKRYLFEHFDMGDDFSSLRIEDFTAEISESFYKNHVPFSFEPTSRRPAATIRKWLTQFSVRRSVIFLLAFGLGMSLEDVELFLTKILGETSFNMIDYKEVIFQFCLRGHLSFDHAMELIARYENDDLGKPSGTAASDYHVGSMDSEEELLDYLRFLKSDVKYENKQQAANQAFDQLLGRTIELIARDKELSRLDHINAGLSSGSTVQLDTGSISLQMVEEVLYSGISSTEDGNLRRMKDSSLGDAFQRYRLSRQRINNIQKGKIAVDRFDLITLLFYIYAQKETEYDEPEDRKAECMQFIDEMNDILARSGMTRLYPVNPYESFILMCLMSADPWDSFCEVWYQSYQ